MLKGRNKVLGVNARNRIYLRANSKKARRIADDKLVTKRILTKNGISAAELIVVINNAVELQNFDVETLPASFVIKPNRGLGGQGILVVYNRLKNGNWLTTNKRQLTGDDLREHISNILDGNFSLLNTPDTTLIEGRLSVSPLYKRFASQGIPDIRIIVYNNVPVMAMIRVPTKKSEGKANLAQGGIGIGIDITTGLTTYAIMKSWLYEKEIDTHPDTGVKLRGVRLPMWSQILETATLAAHATGLKFAGVDISVDKQRGPVVLELNARPGFGIQVANMLPLRERLDRIKGLTVKTPERGIAIAKELFSGQFDAEVENLTGRQVIGLVEPITLFTKTEEKKITAAKIDTGAQTSSIDEAFARELGYGEAIDAFTQITIPAEATREQAEEFVKSMKKEFIALHPDISDLSAITSSHGVSIRMNITIKTILDNRTISVKYNVFDRSHLSYPVLIGTSDLGHYIVDPSKPLPPTVKKIQKTRKQERVESGEDPLYTDEEPR